VNAALITARDGSQSIPQKNLLRVGGKSLLARQIAVAQASSRITPGAVYVSTNGPLIAAEAVRCDAQVIDRPAELSGPTANHGDAIAHAARAIAADGRLDILVVLLGNTAMVAPADVDACVALLEDRPELDSAMTVWEAADDHPYRAMTLAPDGRLVAFPDADRQVPPNRQQYPTVYYYDNGVWALRPRALLQRNGPSPWWWMGERCAPVVRPWVTGRDIHGALDVAIAEWWVAGGHAHAH
jgi:N-acylneuraminate cytidylyltransferase